MSVDVDVPSGRRVELVAAAQRVIAASGLRGLTHRGVDAEAGLAQGTCSAYYRTRAALLGAVTAHIAAQLTARVEGLRAELDALPDDDARRAEIIEWFMRLFAEPELLLVQAELAIEAQRQPGLADQIRHWRRQLLHIVEEIVAAHEPGTPRERAEVIVAALLGVATWALAEPTDQQRAAITMALDALAPPTGTCIS